MKGLVWSIFLCPLLLSAQETGIRFTENLSWEEILQKAKSENKYVMLDCFATWCGPCKWMDKNVYINDTVGAFMNEKFICVRVQMDTGKQDGKDVQRWYETAHELMKKYRITAYPSFLFFSPDGKAVHKDIGAKDVTGFVALTNAAMEPKSQYFTLLNRYQSGGKNYDQWPVLADMAGKLTEGDIKERVARAYLDHLATLSDKNLYTEDTWRFVGGNWNSLHVSDHLFKLLLKHDSKIDTLLHSPGFSAFVINGLIYRDEVESKVQASIQHASEPQWAMLGKTIDKKYGKGYSETNLVKGKVVYYLAVKDWTRYATCLIQQARNNRIDSWQSDYGTSVALNNTAFEVFKYSTDKKELEIALAWSEKAVSMTAKPVAEHLDTKANLLYKLGRKEEGINLEAQTAAMAPTFTDIQENYVKMKQGVPTWPQL